MSKVIFNLHDMILVMTMFLSGVFVVLLILSKLIDRKPSLLLSAFFLAHMMIAFNELSLYGLQFRFEVLEGSPNLIFAGSLAYCLDAVVLYFFTKSVVFKDFSFKLKDSLHLLPLIIYATYLTATYFRLDPETKFQVVLLWELHNSIHYIATENLINIARFIYFLSSLVLINKYHEKHKESRSNLAGVDLNWLRLLLVGFLMIMSLEVVLNVIKLINISSEIAISVLIALGVSIYYFTFGLITILLFYSAVKSTSFKPIMMSEEFNAAEPREIKYSYIQNIESYMDEERPFLNPDITIEELARDLEMSVNDLSVTLNRHFQLNFFEFINQYRVREAKTLLLSKANTTITDLFYEAGFNTKSVFYSAFKKSEGVTPSQYRAMNKANLSA